MADKGASARKEINAATERGFIIPSIKLVTLLMMIRPMSDLIKYVRMQYDMAVRKGRKQWIKEIRRDIEFVLKPSQIDEHLPSLDGSKKKMPQKIAAPANLTTTASTSGMCRDIRLGNEEITISGEHLGNNTATKRECIEHPEPSKRLREDSANSEVLFFTLHPGDAEEFLVVDEVGSEDPMEENDSPSTQPKMRGSRKQKCPLKSCEARSRGIKAHVYRRHLPDCFELSTDEHRHRKINTRLDMLARFVLGSDAQTSALCAHLNTLKAIPAQAALHPTDMLIPDMRAYCRFRNIPIPETFSFHPINSEAVLLHWRPLIHLVQLLTEEQYQQFRNQDENEENEEVQQGPPVAIDSHCHLDRMVRGKVTDVGRILHFADKETAVPVDLQGGVAVFCDPASYPTDDLTFPPGWTMAVGIHPKKAHRTTEDEIQRMTSLIKRPGFAVGEVGLDLTAPFSEWSSQRQLLERILPLVKPSQPLVLHFHARDPWGNDVGARGRAILQKQVAKDQKIHLHCYTGTIHEVRNWLETYPNLYVGYTAIVSNFDVEQQCGLITVPDDRLLLETDSPHLAPGTREENSPKLIGEIAEIVGKIRTQTTNHILKITTENARRLYDLQGSYYQ